MNLYLISQTDVRGYDTYDSTVVAADTSSEAANIDPGSGDKLSNVVGKYDPETWTRDPAKVSVKELGVALAGIGPGVICASFNAG